MKHSQSKPAFTLIEMTIAITVFTVFLGFAMATYLSFHRAQLESAVTRSLMLEMESVMTMLTEDAKSKKIDFDYYNADQALDALRVPGQSLISRLSLASSEGVMSNELALLRPEGGRVIFAWDEDQSQLTLQAFDASGRPLDAYAQPLALNSDQTQVTFVSFHIFPGKDPYDPVNAKENEVQYQPIVQIKMTFARPGRVRDIVEMDLQSSITSRFYQ